MVSLADSNELTRSLEIAITHDHVSVLFYTGLMDPLWMSKLLFAINGKVLVT